MIIDNGGPAFPTEPNTQAGFYTHHGMSLRDFIATHALMGMLAHSKRYKPRPSASGNWHEAISEEAYQLADAMLAERSN